MSAIAAFLGVLCRTLEPGETQEIRTFYRGGPRDGKPGPRKFSADPAVLAAFVAGLPAGLDVYYSVNPRRGEDGTKAGVTRIRFIHVDLDDKHYPGGRAAAVAALNECPLPPTWVIATGGGHQALWAIESVRLTGPADPQLASAEGVMSRLYVALGGLDAVQDVSRVFRLPGTLNTKYDPPHLVAVRHDDPEALYTFEDFAALLPAPAPVARVSRPQLSHDDPSIDELREMLRHIDPQPGYTAWVRVLAAVHSAYPGGDGEAICEEWSGHVSKPGEIARKFRSFGRYKGVRGQASMGTIVYLAKQGGWQPAPRSTAPKFPPQPESEALPGEVELPVVAQLRARVAELEREVEQERAARQKVERFNRALISFDRNKHIKAPKPTVRAVLFEYASRASRGEVDAEGWVPTSRPALGEIGGVSKDTAGDHLEDIAKWGIGIEKRLGREEYWQTDEWGQNVLQSRPRLEVRVNGDVVDTLEMLATFVPPKVLKKDGTEKASHGGKRAPCAACGSTETRRKVETAKVLITTVTCAGCGKVHSETIGDPTDRKTISTSYPVEERDIPKAVDPALLLKLRGQQGVPPPTIVPDTSGPYPSGQTTYTVGSADPDPVPSDPRNSTKRDALRGRARERPGPEASIIERAAWAAGGGR